MNFSIDASFHICALLDNETLKKVYLLHLVPHLSQLASNQLWWHARVDTLTQRQVAISQQEVDWRQTYCILKSKMQLDNELLFWNEQDNVTVLDILDNMAIPGRVDLCAAAKKGSIKILTWLLRDGRVDPQGCLDLAIREGRDEAVRLLLLDPRVDIDGVLGGRTPLMLACRARHEDRISSYVKIVEMLLANNRLNTDRIQGCMYQVCIGQDNADIIDLLLRDGRIDPTSNRTRVLIDAVSAGKFNIVARLLQDPRVDPNARRGEPLRQACLSGYTNIVKLLLSDPRTDPTIDDYCALITSAGIGREAETKLLLADKRVLDSMKHQELDERLTYDNAHPYLTLLVRDALGL